ncbi:MAG TPA: hypothetical protein VNT53_11230 [Pseudolysinimonas sp.]|nr:hypothetical protein [Pseudolysinimonas sp.]
MLRFQYAGSSFLTGDAIAEAVLDLGATLARVQSSTYLDVPGITSKGVRGIFRVLLGPASQMLLEPTLDQNELEDPDFVAQVRSRIAQLERTPRALPVNTPPSTYMEFDQ